jgi:sensor histidine kinase YesM
MNILNLPKYSIKSIIIRVIGVTTIAVAYMQILLYILNTEGSLPEYLTLILGFNILMEVNIILNSIYEKIFPLPKKLSQRMFVNFIVGIALLISLFFGLTALIPYHLKAEKEVFYFNLGIGLMLMNGISSRLILHSITKKLFQSQNQIAKLKQEKLKMDYMLLQDKLNPHFLFNNLTVLKSYIYHKSDDALPFIEDFTDVYRYVLQSNNKQLVNLEEEMEFIHSFIDLHKSRLNEGLIVDISVDEHYKQHQISPLTLQLLVENVIKHNIASKTHPLEIKIYTNNNYITVDNNIRRKKSTYSTKTGLKNLINRYSLLTDKKIILNDDDKRFIVKVPLL